MIFFKEERAKGINAKMIELTTTKKNIKGGRGH